MAEISGKAGEVTIDGTTVAGIKEWTLDISADALETTDLGDSGHRTYIAGLDGWSGSFTGPRDGTEAASIGSSVSLVLKLSQTSGQQYSGTAIITGIHPSVSVDGVAMITYDFQGTGALTAPTA